MSAKTPPLVAFACLIDSINAWLGRICAWLPVFLVVGTAVVVILRYGFGIGATGLQEAVMYGHAWSSWVPPPGRCNRARMCG